MIPAGQDLENPESASRRSTLLVLPLGLLWLLALALGMRAMADYQFGAGTAKAAPPTWPAGTTAVSRAADLPALVLFAHPRCPCTRASVAELTRILTRCGVRIDAKVLFYRPADAPAGWERTDTWDAAAAIPGVRVLADVDGAEARRFGAATSGQALLYAADGALLFRGGITASRGQIGESTGADAITALLASGGAGGRPAESPVYGCPIVEDGAATQGGGAACPE